MRRSLALACMCLFAQLLVLPARAEVSASVDRSNLSLSETFELTLRVNGALNTDEPELAPLQQDFEILSTSRNHRMSFSQGQRESWTEWVVVLLAKRSGALSIPSISVGDEASTAIGITVSEGQSAGSTATGDIRLEVRPEAEEIRLQQQLLVRVRLQHAVNLASGASLDELEVPGAVVRKLDEGSHEELIGGRRFGVFERLYAVYPQKSGELRIPALRFRGSAGGNAWFDNGGRQYRLQSDEQEVRVLPPEQGVSPWIPARNLSIVETWDREPDALRAGESATRSLTITAEGLTGAQIPPIPEPDVPGVRFYADKPEVSDASGANGLTGTRIQRVALIPQQAGDLELPELRVRWWNTAQSRFEEALVPARKLRVLPGQTGGPSPSAAAVDPAPAASPGTPTEADIPAMAETPTASPAFPGAGATTPWMIATAASLALAAFFALQWLRLRSASRVIPQSGVTEGHSEKQAFEKLRESCGEGDAGAAASALLRWGRAAFPAADLRSLGALCSLTGDNALRTAVDEMIASRYGAHAKAWDGRELLRVTGRHRPGSGGKTLQDRGLPPLYATD